LAAILAPDLEPDPLGALFARLEPRLRRVATRYVRDPDAAADVVQHAFEKALRHIAQFRGQAQPSTWLHRIVVNEALMWLRSERRRRARSVSIDRDDAAERPDPAPLALDALERDEERRRVRGALARLRPADRELLERSVLDDVGTVRFARAAGLDPAVVKSRAYRARRQLAALLRDSA
jgi:RNA polymerase sigma-70 factor (ECF subfamily)